MAEEFVSDNEETLIQSAVHDYHESPETNALHYSSEDPYTQLPQCDLSEDVQLVKAEKCLAFVSQLLVLSGKKC